MLVISRKSGESIRIGDDIVIRIGRTTGSKVSLVVEAPREVPIVRSELVFDDDDARDRTPTSVRQETRRETVACP